MTKGQPRTTIPSPRALQILGLLANGQTKRDIARQLYLTPSTVNTHMRLAFELLRARTAAQAVGIAIGEGLIPAPVRPTVPWLTSSQTVTEP